MTSLPGRQAVPLAVTSFIFLTQQETPGKFKFLGDHRFNSLIAKGRGIVSLLETPSLQSEWLWGLAEQKEGGH